MRRNGRSAEYGQVIGKATLTLYEA